VSKKKLLPANPFRHIERLESSLAHKDRIIAMLLEERSVATRELQDVLGIGGGERFHYVVGAAARAIESSKRKLETMRRIYRTSSEYDVF
jgi:hypothetical protein